MKYGMLWTIKTLGKMLWLRFIVTFIAIPEWKFIKKRSKEPLARWSVSTVLVELKMTKWSVDVGISNIFAKIKDPCEWYDEWNRRMSQHNSCLTEDIRIAKKFIAKESLKE